MLNLGTVRPGSTIRIPFSTFDKDDGSSITMTNYAAADILVYKDGSTTERASTSGFTATTDFDSKTGKHIAVIDLADNTTAGFWNAGSEYLVAIDAVTVDAVTTGGWIARFQIGYQGANLDTTIASLSSQTSFTLTAGPAEDDALNGHWAIIHDIASAVQRATVLISDYAGSTKTVTLVAGATFTAAAGDNISVMDLAPLQPTVLGRMLDVSSGGEAGIDWANIGSPSTAQNLSATNIDVDQVVASVSGAVGSVTGNVGGNVTGSVGSVATGGITAGSIAADAIGASELATDAVSEIAAAVWAEASRTLTAIDEDSTTLDLDATIRAAVGLASANLDTQLAAIDDAVDSEVGAIKAVTDKLDNTLENTSDGWIFSVNALQNAPSGTGASASDIADEVQTRTIAAVNLVNGLAANTVTASALAADAVTEIQSGLATAAALVTVDTVVDAIKVTTDKLDTTVELGDTDGNYRFTALALENAAAGSLTAADVWAHATRTLTAIDEDSTTLDLDATIRGAVGLAAANLDTQIDALPTAAENANAVWGAGARTLTALDEDSTTVDLDATVRAAVGLASANLDTQLSTIDTVVDDVDLRGERTVVRGTADSGASTTSIPTSAFSPAGAAADQFKGRIVVFDNDTTTAALRGQATDITASSNSATPTLTVTALTTAPAAGDTFSVL